MNRHGSFGVSALAVFVVVVAVLMPALYVAQPLLAAALMFVLVVAALAFTLRDIELILHVLVVSVFFESVSVGPIRIGRLLALVAILTIGARILLTGWRPPWLPPRAWVPVVLFVGWSWLSGTWARYPGGWHFAIGQLLLAGAYFLAFALFVRTSDQVRLLLRTYALGAGLAAVIGVLQWSTNVRATGLQGDPNLFALYQVAAIPAAIALARTARTAQARRWWIALLVPLLLSVLASQSRGGLLSTLLVGVLLLATGNIPRERVIMLLGVASLVVLVAAGGTLNDRLNPDRIEKDRASGRLDIWYVAWHAFTERPATGLGGGNFKEYSIRLLEQQPGVELVKSHLLAGEGIEVHNVYLEMLAEYGLPGFLLFGGVLISTASGLRLVARRRTTAAAIALPGMLAAYATSAFFLSVVNNKLLWILAGTAAAARSRRPAGVLAKMESP